MESKFISTRKHELDWLRVFAILVLLFFHTGRIFNVEGWHIKNNEVSGSFDYWMPFLHSWRMPLLLFISGAGSYFAFKSAGSFLIQRCKRLIIPLIFGMITVLPLQFYFEHITEFSNVWDVYKSFLDYFPFYNGVMNLYHLWFLENLFLYSLIALPVLIFLHSSYSAAFKTWFMRYFFSPVAVLLVPALLILATQIILFANHPGRAFFVFYLCFFLVGIIFYCNSEYSSSVARGRKYFLGVSICILIPYILYYPFQGFPYLFGRLPIGLALEIFVGWFWIVTIIAYGQHYLRNPHPLLTTIGDGIISFYILHQTVIVVIGYYICQLQWSIAAKFLTINVLTLAFCVAFYLLCIRPYNVMRIAFGMKLLPASTSVSSVDTR